MVVSRCREQISNKWRQCPKRQPPDDNKANPNPQAERGSFDISAFYHS